MKIAALSAVAHLVGLVAFSALPRFMGPPPMPHTTIAEIVPASALFPPSPQAGAPQAQGQTPSQRAEAARKAIEDASRPKPPKPPPPKPPEKKAVARKDQPRTDPDIPPLEPDAEPKEEEAPEPAQDQGGSGEEAAAPGEAGGISFGSGAAGGVPSIGSSAFPYDYYRASLVAILQSNWRRPVAPEGLTQAVSCRVQFTILKSGIIQDPRIAAPSGNSALDQSALRAVYDSNPLPPLPYQYGHASVSAEVLFELTPG